MIKYLNKISSKYINYSLIIISTVFLLITSIIIDRMSGFFLSIDGIIFRPNTISYYETSEFKFTAKINKYGFRDRDFNVDKINKQRIIIIGDSFTYGWGVNIEESWPKILEYNLVNRGFDLEICNLGKPGGSPADYVNIAERAIPILKPDVVVVAVLQGDDIMQLTHYENFNDNFLKPKNVIAILYPNTIRLVKYFKNNIIITQEQIKEEWQKKAIQTIKSFNEEQRDRFYRLSDHVRHLFFSGELNPVNISVAIKQPTYFMHTFHIYNDKVKSLIQKMSVCFGKIKHIADKYKLKIIIVSIPIGPYVSKYYNEKYRELGYLLNSDMLSSDSADKVIEVAGKKAGINFITVTDKFREKVKYSRLYYDFDGHFNIEGHKEYAELLTTSFERYLEENLTSGSKK